MRLRVRHLASLVVLVAMSLAGCAGEPPSVEPPGPIPLTDDQAARLAQAGFTNLQSGGARFEANSAFLVGQSTETLRLTGVVDWTQRIGWAEVSATGPDATLSEVYWESDVMLERRPTADALIASRGGPPQSWIARPPDTSTRQLDRLVSIITALALAQADNALLIQQAPGSAFIRLDELRGEPVEVLRYGNRNLYWLAVSDGRMMRFEGNSSTGTAPTIVDLLETAQVSVPLPLREAVVWVDDVAEIYEAMLSS
jgi:hypothetical protein